MNQYQSIMTTALGLGLFLEGNERQVFEIVDSLRALAKNRRGKLAARWLIFLRSLAELKRGVTAGGK